MVSTAVSEPTTMSEYLYPEPAESSLDAQSDQELLPDQDGIQSEQSSDDPNRVAPETESAQPETETDEAVAVESDSSEADTVPVAPNWDSPENPHFEQAKAFQAIQQLAQQRQSEADEKARRDAWMAGFSSLAEADESDIPVLAGSLIEDIQKNAVVQYQQELAIRDHGFNALIAGLESTFSPAEVEKVRTAAKQWQTRGQTAQEIEQTFLAEQSARTRYDSQLADMNTKIKNLTAQLAAKAIQDSGVNRTETTAVGANGAEEYESMLEYLTGPPR